MTLEPPPSLPLCSLRSHKCSKYDKAQYVISSHPKSPWSNLYARLVTRCQVKLTPRISIDTPTNTF